MINKYTLTFSTIVALLYLSLLLYCFPILDINTYTIGKTCDDLFDETVLEFNTAYQLKHGESILTNKCLLYPEPLNLIVSHKSFLQVLFISPLLFLLPYPLWWNIAVLSSIFITALTVYACILLLSENRLFSTISGALFILYPCLIKEISQGQIPQLCFAPFAAAITFIYLTVNHEKQPSDNNSHKKLNYIYIILAYIFILITTFIYWIWGILLLIFGICAVITCKTDKKSLIRTAILIAITSATILPIAIYTLKIDKDMSELYKIRYDKIRERTYFTSALASTDTISRKILTFLTATNNANFDTDFNDDRILSVQNRASIIITIAIFLFAIISFNRGNRFLWALYAIIMYLICMGTYLDKYLTDEPFVKLPIAFIINWSGYGYRFRTFNVAWPAVLFSLCCLSAILSSSSEENQNSKISSYLKITFSILLMILCILISWIPCLQDYNFKSYLYPYFKTNTPKYTEYLKSMPAGAVIDLPLCYTANTWHNIPMHEHPIINGKRYINGLIKTNHFLIFLLKMQLLTAYENGMTINNYSCRTATELPYGIVSPNTSDNNSHPHDNVLQIMKKTTRKLQAQEIHQGREQLQSLNIKYAVLHKANCQWFTDNPNFYRLYGNLLKDLFGEPDYSDEQVMIFIIKPNKAQSSPDYKTMLQKMSAKY